MSVITLLTDFGTRDWFVGTMKGVILGINPRVTIADITHDVPPHDVGSAAFILSRCAFYYPQGTIHIAVVDPGVGSSRNALIVRAKNRYFVAPDNGILSYVLADESFEAWKITNKKYLLKPVGTTFHGRDVFAPVAAHLSRGVSPSKIGPKITKIVRFALPKVRKIGQKIVGEVIYVDKFGNAITNISQKFFAAGDEIWLRGRKICRVERFYAAVAARKPLGVVGSTGHLEIAVNEGNAAKLLHLKIGDEIHVKHPL
jgi:S-adenosylmethionine hydrolase